MLNIKVKGYSAVINLPILEYTNIVIESYV